MKLLLLGVATAVLLALNQASAGSIEGRASESAQIVALNLNTDDEIQKISQEVFYKLSSLGDTQLQSEAKALIAQYLVEASMQADTESENTGRNGESQLSLNPVPYGTHHHTSHHDWWHQQQAQVPAVPAVPAVQAVPVVTQQAVIQAAPAATNEVRQDTITQRPVTQVPIIVPAASGDAAVPVGSAPVPSAPVASPVAAPVAPVAPVTAAPIPAALTTPRPTLIPAPTVDPVHHLNQVNKILGNVANGNIVGIVDESLAIRAPPPVRNLVTNIMKIIFCNPIDRILRRCAANQVAAANSSVKGK